MKKIELNSVGVLLCYVGLALISALVFSMSGIAVALLDNPDFSLALLQDHNALSETMSKKNSLITIQVFSSIGTFLIPALLVPVLFKGYSFKNSLHFNKPHPLLLVLCGTILFYGILILTVTLADLNALFPISEYWKSLEATNLAAQKLLIQGNSTTDLIVTLGVVALLPALVEEITFRGIALHLFDSVFKNKYVAIILQGAIFGAIHFNMGQILPIIGIGIVFGYIAYETKSIWYTVLLHFLNNSLAAISLFYADKYAWAKNLDTDQGLPLIHYILGFIALAIGFYLFYKYKSLWFKTSSQPKLEVQEHFISSNNE
jgi:membrane protease YdiL (CAAX protease family)